eukprot:GDKJ01060687.1.p1 GENE.GDKJ01060687.1~~GDKJ01060687.1.p1  ORF type:complete len:707 (+),score=187.57 GDKJ01060687.1:24-2144(+)
MSSAVAIDAISPHLVPKAVKEEASAAHTKRLDAPDAFWNLLWAANGLRFSFLVFDFFAKNNLFGGLEIVSLLLSFAFCFFQYFSIMSFNLLWILITTFVYGASLDDDSYVFRSHLVSIFSAHVMINCATLIIGIIILENGDIQQMVKSDPVIPYARVTIRRMSEIIGSVPMLPHVLRKSALSNSELNNDSEISQNDIPQHEALTEAGHAREYIIENAVESLDTSSYLKTSEIRDDASEIKTAHKAAHQGISSKSNGQFIFQLHDSHDTIESNPIVDLSDSENTEKVMHNEARDKESHKNLTVSGIQQKGSLCVTSTKGLPWNNSTQGDLRRTISDSIATENNKANTALKVEYVRAEFREVENASVHDVHNTNPQHVDEFDDVVFSPERKRSDQIGHIQNNYTEVSSIRMTERQDVVNINDLMGESVPQRAIEFSPMNNLLLSPNTPIARPAHGSPLNRVADGPVFKEVVPVVTQVPEEATISQRTVGAGAVRSVSAAVHRSTPSTISVNATKDANKQQFLIINQGVSAQKTPSRVSSYKVAQQLPPPSASRGVALSASSVAGGQTRSIQGANPFVTERNNADQSVLERNNSASPVPPVVNNFGVGVSISAMSPMMEPSLGVPVMGAGLVGQERPRSKAPFVNRAQSPGSVNTRRLSIEAFETVDRVKMAMPAQRIDRRSLKGSVVMEGASVLSGAVNQQQQQTMMQ